jgi:predicted  nucleic acid-binding Zn-ribbon protein
VRYSDYAALKTELDEWKRGSETVNSQLLKRIELLEAQLSKAQHLLREDMEIFEADLMSIGHGPDSLARTRSMTGLGDRIAKLDEFLNPNKDP